jgi:hypothetical protein
VEVAGSQLRIARRFRGPPAGRRGRADRARPPDATGGPRRGRPGRLLRRPLVPRLLRLRPRPAPGDGLRILPGPVPRRSLVAAPWTPDPSVAGPEGQLRDEVVWAALDCPGGLAALEAAAVPAGRGVLLGQMTARLAARPRVGTEYRVVAWPAGREGRKLTAGSAVLGPGGEVLAAARALWIIVEQTAGGPA